MALWQPVQGAALAVRVGAGRKAAHMSLKTVTALPMVAGEWCGGGVCACGARAKKV